MAGDIFLKVDVSRTLEVLDFDWKEYQTLFNIIDHSKTNKVSFAEIESLVTFLEITISNRVILYSLFRQVDQDEDGELSKDEFIIFLYRARNFKDTGEVEKIIIWQDNKKAQYYQKKTLDLKVWNILEDPQGSYLGVFVSATVMALTLLSVLSFCIETIPAVENEPSYQRAFIIIECICNPVFTLEYLIRLIVTPKKRQFALSILNAFDLVSIAPFYFSLITGGKHDSEALRVVRLFRVFRVFKFSRYLEWLKIMTTAFAAVRHPLSIALSLFISISLLFSCVMFIVDQPKSIYELDATFFGSVYWSFITMTTVGYGDVHPTTTSGKLVATITMLFGVLLLAIPISLFSASFNDKLECALKRKIKVLEQNEFLRMRATLLDKDKNSVKNDYSSYGVLDSRCWKRYYGSHNRNKRLRFIKMWKQKCIDENISDSKSRIQAGLDIMDLGLSLASNFDSSVIRRRNEYRTAMLVDETERIISKHRTILWSKVRVLERRKRELLYRQLLRRYNYWFVETKESREKALEQAVIRLQACARGNQCRLMVTAKVGVFRNKMKGKMEETQKNKHFLEVKKKENISFRSLTLQEL